MIIGIASPISSKAFSSLLYEKDKHISQSLSETDAPAVTTLALELLRMNHTLIIFTLDKNIKKATKLEGKNLIIYVAPAYSKGICRKLDVFYWGIKNIRKLFKMNSHKLDVLSVHWTRDYAIAAFSLLGKYPIFVTVRDIMPYIIKQHKGLHNYVWYLNYLKNEIVMRNKQFNFIANSDYTANKIMHYWGYKVPIIYNPILNDYFNLSLSDERKNNTEFNIISISISSPEDDRKNIYTLVKAFKEYRSINPLSNLYLVGEAFCKQNKTICKWDSDNLLEGIHLVGKVPHDKIITLLRKASLLVHPSKEETFGNTLIEAMACGCPIIGGKNSGAVPYVLDKGRAGFLCDVESVDSIVQTIDYIFNHPGEVREKIIYARNYCQKKYSSSKTSQEYLRLFSEKIKPQ